MTLTKEMLAELRMEPQDLIFLNTPQVLGLLKQKSGTWRSLVSRDLAPKPDGYYTDRSPYWMLQTIFDYSHGKWTPPES